MKSIWFIHQGGSVQGPLSSVEVERRLAGGTVEQDALVWARGANEWTPISGWAELKAQVESGPSVTSSKVWYCDDGSGTSLGPLTQDELIHHIKGHTRLEGLRVWGTNLERWTPLFEVPEVMELVGISRREHPRAPLLGQAAIASIGSEVPAQVLSTQTVSVGGFSVKLAGALSVGDRVHIAIKSRDLPSTIHASGEILYISRAGEAGVKFSELSAEARAILHDHVKRFHSPMASAA